MSDELYIWIGLVGLGAITVLSRCAILLWPGPLTLPPRLQRALRYAPMAAFAAVIAPATLLSADGVMVQWTHPRVLAVVAALLAWWISRRMPVSMIAGLSVYVLTRLAGELW
jgi:branched-subunit amino acid transport protein